jgi:hypothetical protein
MLGSCQRLARTGESKLLTLAKAEEHGKHVDICTIIFCPLNLRHRVRHLELEGTVEPSLLFAKVALHDRDRLRWKVKNLDSVDGVILRPSQHNKFQYSLEDWSPAEFSMGSRRGSTTTADVHGGASWEP